MLGFDRSEAQRKQADFGSLIPDLFCGIFPAVGSQIRFKLFLKRVVVPEHFDPRAVPVSSTTVYIRMFARRTSFPD
jgi:hypothetical protein